MDKLLEFKENGFIDCYTRIFYSYQAINYIEPIKYFEDDDYFHIYFGYCSKAEALASKRYFFTITVKDNQDIKVGYVYSINLYNKIERKNWITKFLFGKYKYILNPQLGKFYNENVKEIQEDLINLKLTRQELIDKFNAWKEKC